MNLNTNQQPPQTIAQLTHERGKTSIFPELTEQRGERIFSVTNVIHADAIIKCAGQIQKRVNQKHSKRDFKIQMGSSKYDPTVKTFSEILKLLNVIAKQAFQDNAAKFIQIFVFGKLSISIQQVFLKKIKNTLLRKK